MEVENGLISNGLTVAVVALIWIVVQRLRNCSSGCQTSWFHCESERVKIEKQVNLFKRALSEFQRESQRDGVEITVAD